MSRNRFVGYPQLIVKATTELAKNPAKNVLEILPKTCRICSVPKDYVNIITKDMTNGNMRQFKSAI